ncbi:MAG: hypothetical protein QM756_02570 [Polyangiaceae bacterium]
MKGALSSLLSSESSWALSGIAACALLLGLGRGSGVSQGDVMPLSVTVVPADARTLECDLQPTQSTRCAFTNGSSSGAAGPFARPYVTVEGELVILSGVFESPAVREWLERAQREHSSERVTLRCRVEFEGMLRDVGVRFSPSGAFEKHPSVMGGSVRTCKVSKR